jgi:predicted Kef-type K+ transport protein
MTPNPIKFVENNELASRYQDDVGILVALFPVGIKFGREGVIYNKVLALVSR